MWRDCGWDGRGGGVLVHTRDQDGQEALWRADHAESAQGDNVGPFAPQPASSLTNGIAGAGPPERGLGLCGPAPPRRSKRGRQFTTCALGRTRRPDLAMSVVTSLCVRTFEHNTVTEEESILNCKHSGQCPRRA